MTLAEKQAEWSERYALIPDAQERLSTIIARRSRLEPLREGERTEAHLVPGCVSRVWLAGGIDGQGRLRLRVDAEAALVRGLAGFVAEFFDGEPAADVGGFSFALLDDLRLTRQLTPTRAQGMQHVVRRIQALAAGA